MREFFAVLVAVVVSVGSACASGLNAASHEEVGDSPEKALCLKPVRSLRIAPGYIRAHTNQQYLCVHLTNGTVTVFDTALIEVASLKLGLDESSLVDFVPEKGWLLAWSWQECTDGGFWGSVKSLMDRSDRSCVSIYDISTGEQLAEFTVAGKASGFVADDGSDRIACESIVGGMDRLSVYDLEVGAMMSDQMTDFVIGMAFHSDTLYTLRLDYIDVYASKSSEDRYVRLKSLSHSATVLNSLTYSVYEDGFSQVICYNHSIDTSIGAVRFIASPSIEYLKELVPAYNAVDWARSCCHASREMLVTHSGDGYYLVRLESDVRGQRIVFCEGDSTSVAVARFMEPDLVFVPVKDINSGLHELRLYRMDSD